MVEASKICYKYGLFSPLRMMPKEALKRLFIKGAVEPIEPKSNEPEDKRNARNDITIYYNYHRGKGHRSEQCVALKYGIQDTLKHH